jgi:hypothetical protein
MPTHLYFMRHGGYVEDLENGTYQDLGLSPEGIRQVECLLTFRKSQRRNQEPFFATGIEWLLISPLVPCRGSGIAIAYPTDSTTGCISPITA